VVLSFAFALGTSKLVFEHLFHQHDGDPALSTFAFIFLVALGVDYNIFLISRIREESAKLGNREGVISGLQKTGGVITSAGLILAVGLNNRTRLGALFQASIFSSYVVSWVAVSLLWIWLLDPQYGLVAYLFGRVGLPAVNWLGDHRIALWSLVLVTVWKTVGYPLVIYLAGLQAIPGDLYEAAALDGAGGWQRFRHITWPLLAPTSLFLLITLTVASFQGFDIVRIMTQGGPVTATMIYVYYIYEQAFQYFKLGKASAAVVVFFALIVALTFLQWRLFRRRLHDTA